MFKEPDTPGAAIVSWLIDFPIKDKQGIDSTQL
jgi:hypothetical protein